MRVGSGGPPIVADPGLTDDEDMTDNTAPDTNDLNTHGAQNTAATAKPGRLRTAATVAGLAAGALFIGACGVDFEVSFGEDGNGVIETRTFALPEFDRIEIDAIYDVSIEVDRDATPAVSITTDENLFDELEVEVINGELVLDIDGSIDPSSDLDVTIVVAELAELQTDGVSSAWVEGSGGDLVIKADGASSIDAGDYDAANVIVDVDGVSSVELSARNAVTGSADGASSVDIHQADSVDVDTGGIADVDLR